MSATDGGSAARMRSVTIKGVEYLYMRDIGQRYSLRGRMNEKTCDLKGGGHVLHFERDKREARIDGVCVNLSFPPAAGGGGIVLSKNDVWLMLDPLLAPSALPRGTVRRIMLDPGHGGRDQGTSGRQQTERDLCFKIALKLKVLLEAAGCEVRMTRKDNKTTLELDQRVAFAARKQSDIFISLHMNSAKDRTVHGIETFLVAPDGTSSTYETRAWKGAKSGTQFDRLNTRLAYDLHQNVVAATGAEDRAVKHANFLVLRKAPCPALLVEMGFLSNAAEEMSLASSSYQDKVAKGLAAGIIAYARNVAPASPSAGGSAPAATLARPANASTQPTKVK